MSSERTDGREGAVEYRGTGFKVSLVLIFLTAALVLILAVQNTAPVTLVFLAWEVELPLFAAAPRGRLARGPARRAHRPGLAPTAPEADGGACRARPAARREGHHD
jgi:hypothetical protein